MRPSTTPTWATPLPLAPLPRSHAPAYPIGRRRLPPSETFDLTQRSLDPTSALYLNRS